MISTSCHWRRYGANQGHLFQWGAVRVMDIFPESGQEGLKISYRILANSFVSNIILKHRHVLGNEIVSWTVASIKISFLPIYLSIYLSLSLAPLLPPSISLQYSGNNFMRVDTEWHMLASIAVQDLTNILHFPYNLHSNIQMFVLK